MTRYLQGKFQPHNPKKYKGDPTNICFRSGWELSLMQRFDRDENVVSWGSEECIVPYQSPVDNKLHRYFPDFVAVLKKPDGTLKTVMIEIKPMAQLQRPTQPKRVTKAFIEKVKTYAVNEAKFNAARALCEDKGWEFVVMTEKDLGV